MQACEAISVLASLAELDVRVTFLSQAQVDHGRRDIGEVVTAIEGQVDLVLALELLELLGVGPFHPAGGGDVDRLVQGLDVVLALEARDHHVELQHTDRTDDEIVALQRTEHLHRPLFGELYQPLEQLFLLEGVAQADAAEQFRREVRDAGELEIFTLGEGVTDLDGAVVVQADDVAGARLDRLFAITGHEGHGVGDVHILAQTHVAHLHALGVGAGDDAHKGDTVAVLRIHVRLDLEHEAGELLLGRHHFTALGLARHGRRRPVGEAVQHVVDTEVAECGTEEDRSHLAGDEGVVIELGGGALHQLQFTAQLGRQIVADGCIQLGVVQPLDHPLLLDGVALTTLIQIGLVLVEVIDPLEGLAAADGPGDGGAHDVELALHLVHHFHGIAHFAVQLVHEGEDGGVAQPGYFHQLAGPVFNTLGGVDDHQAAVDRRQGTVGIFGEVLVTRGIEQVDQTVGIGELHHRGSDGDTTLLLHLHPVGFGVLARATALDGTGALNGLSEQQDLFGDGGFTRIRVRDDSKGPSLIDFIKKILVRHV